ncbi:MAG: SH3 domain-containing protein [Methyloceanibacter sp.]
MTAPGTIPSGQPAPSALGPATGVEAGLGTVQPSVFVNMRERPSSSSPVLGVIARGAELPVLDRKRGWVEVAHPESGKQGWIYSGLLVGEAKPNRRVRRAAPAEPEGHSESFWGTIGRWISPSPETSKQN